MEEPIAEGVDIMALLGLPKTRPVSDEQLATEARDIYAVYVSSFACLLLCLNFVFESTPVRRRSVLWVGIFSFSHLLDSTTYLTALGLIPC